MMMSMEQGDHDVYALLPYLHRISSAIDMLAHEEDITTEKSQSAELIINQLSLNLLRACHPERIGLPVPASLVTLTNDGVVVCDGEKESNDKMDVDDDDNQDRLQKVPRVRRLRNRMDYIRSILRAMPPIALDVGAVICSTVATTTMSNKERAPAASFAAFVLFATWLPIAPQLTPLVSELFGLASFPPPLEYSHHGGKVSMSTTRFLLADASHKLCRFFAERGDCSILSSWWSWSQLFGMLHWKQEGNNVVMEDTENQSEQHDKNMTSRRGWTERPFDVRDATKWHAGRAVAHLLDLRSVTHTKFLQSLNVQESTVPWVMHPWILLEEEEQAQLGRLCGVTTLFNNKEDRFQLPLLERVRASITVHPSLVHVGEGALLVRRSPLSYLTATATTQADKPTDSKDLAPPRKKLILTPTTARNLSLLGAALCEDPYPPPILVCGPHGSGKSSLVRELARYCAAPAGNVTSHREELLELHVDEETDSKTLIGSFTTTDIPGEFTWQPGALTRAVRMGKWVLLEDVDTVPVEIQAALVQLLEDRLLPLGGGKVERCHSNFRIFGTCATSVEVGSVDEKRSGCLRSHMSNAGPSKRVLHPALWRKVHVDPLPFSELSDVSRALYPSLPKPILDAALNVFRSLDRSGRTRNEERGLETEAENDINKNDRSTTLDGAEPGSSLLAHKIHTLQRTASVRDYMKLLSRISNAAKFEKDATYATESQRTLCLAETVDIFAGSCPSAKQRQDFASDIAAPIWGITADLALRYMETRSPSITVGTDYTEVGRATITNSTLRETSTRDERNFVQTNHSLRLMESIAVCVAQNEPVLLVGETGLGKTYVTQQLAKCCDREIIVQNLSLQTDSTDLLGGYRPLEMKHIAQRVYLQFVNLFVSTFSRRQNMEFLDYVSSAHEKGQWKRLSQSFRRAAKLGLKKVQEIEQGIHVNKQKPVTGLEAWSQFHSLAERFERQRLASDSGLAFAFTDGALVDAIQHGKWVLLDEINLASSETLQRLCGLLDDSIGSVTLTERGDTEALKRHPDFRLFAAMNPATDAGKKDLLASIRSRFTELYVDELLDPLELRDVASKYLHGVVPPREDASGYSEAAMSAVDVYIQCRELSEQSLVDTGGQRPRYTMRTLCRALTAARNLCLQQRFPPKRAVLEGFQASFEGPLDNDSMRVVQKLLRSTLGKGLTDGELQHPMRRPGSRNENTDYGYVLVKPFWIKSGPLHPTDWAEKVVPGFAKFILTPSMAIHLRRIARAVASGPWPVLLEGPTSAGKTTLVEYLAARCGHHCVRINNHEHTDVQEYTGSYSADAKGSLSFQDGILVRALRNGHWVILDELNLAPSEVLEALNRLLDDNRELYLPETNETVKPHSNFRLFATQNPSGVYGGRKTLSRAFRNRFVELHMGDIPTGELSTILELRCGCPASHAKLLVNVMKGLRLLRSKSGIFLGKNGLITPRDLLRWAERKATTTTQLAQQGYMLLAERLRTEEERNLVRDEIENQLKVTIDCDELYYGETGEARTLMDRLAEGKKDSSELIASVAPTKSLLRLLSLVLRCMKQKEPVLLVGDTGCGKTTVVQLLSDIMDMNLLTINCHATTETSDILGGLRPVRGRNAIALNLAQRVNELLKCWPEKSEANPSDIPDIVNGKKKVPNAEDVDEAIAFTRSLWKSRENSMTETSTDAKRRKLETGSRAVSTTSNFPHQEARDLVHDIESLYRRYSSIFEWVDGPLVRAMKDGHMILLDEMSLAEDAVLERFNSVLEPSRSIVLAEKSVDGMLPNELHSHVVRAHENFQIFATMNPGGDFGKRELSPALRSRFTEIWVPPVTDLHDVDLVLEWTLASRMTRLPSETLAIVNFDLVRRKMLEYVGWFNDRICGTASVCAELALSLRDVLAWSRFVADVLGTTADIRLWDAYRHGSCLMHLDGLGLGTGMSREDAEEVRSLAHRFISDQIPFEHKSANAILETAHGVDEKTFFLHPFSIPLGSEPISKCRFNFDAPTTAMNVMRVLRAMQLSKPLLLEGSPGVGKTSLVSAIAEASGHRLVRINLSEQTDVSDLLGSDLPLPEETRGTAANNNQSFQSSDSSGLSCGPSFKWCDGVLLQAIKRGDWVLLDELNLASQAVLEGLNSCLDHRASVYIPELGQAFACPSTFRVFAAQNPLAQGGGRKGLPKSFLNRFTKVYIDPHTQEDLRAIVCTRFPSMPESLVRSMIQFNSTVQRDVVEKHEYGVAGSPWEFNLRDVFRWCELVSCMSCTENPEMIGQFAGDLYFQRFRTKRDRDFLCRRYKECFGTNVSSFGKFHFQIRDDTVEIGSAVLARRTSSSFMVDHLPVTAPVLRTLCKPMETLTRCIQMNWPCLVVGPPSSGKTTLLKGLAELSNVRLAEVSLTPASDVNELVGSFEQVDCEQQEKMIFESIGTLYVSACNYLAKNTHQVHLLGRISECYFSLKTATGCMSTSSLQEPLLKCCEFLNLLSEGATANDDFAKSCGSLIASLLQAVTVAQKRGTTETHKRDESHFRWVDGVLVKAMTNGDWLHLANANLCPSAVLDRLNPLMEKGGELLLAECSVNDGGATGDTLDQRVVKPHPDFRIVLSMDPSAGEVSRAMRNRCVEISLLPVCEADLGVAVTRTSDAQPMRLRSSTAVVDSLDALWNAGIRSSLLATRMLSLHCSECVDSNATPSENPSVRNKVGLGYLISSHVRRGWIGLPALCKPLQLTYEIDGRGARTRILRAFLGGEDIINTSPLVNGFSLTNSWTVDPFSTQSMFAARLIKLVSERSSQTTVSTLFPGGLYRFHGDGSENCTDLSTKSADIPVKCNLFESLKLCLIALYAQKCVKSGFALEADTLEGYDDISSKYLRSMLLHLRNHVEEFTGVIVENDDPVSIVEQKCSSRLPLANYKEANFSKRDYYMSLFAVRLPHLIQEQLSYQNCLETDLSSPSSVQMSAMQVSLCLNEGLFDRSSVSCAVTPILHPLFQAVDSLERVISISIYRDKNAAEDIYDTLLKFVIQRDRMWTYLNDCRFTMRNEAAFLGFREAGFVVQWVWFKKRLAELKCRLNRNVCPPENTLESPLENKKMGLDILVERVDRILFDSLGSSSYSFDALWKHGGHPLVPSSCRDWSAISGLRACSREFALRSDSCIDLTESSLEIVDLSALITRRHPVLFIEPEEKHEILAAMCMAHWSTTDEMRAEIRKDSLPYDCEAACSMFSKKLSRRKQSFAAELDSIKIDSEIQTVDNIIGMEKLERLKAGLLDSSNAGGNKDIVESLLHRFGFIQTSQLAEYWCVKEETRITGQISKALLLSKSSENVLEKVNVLLPAVKKFVDVALSETAWDIADVRPYQTLIWACEAHETNDIVHLLRCILPLMMNSASQHTWCNTFNDLRSVSLELVFPALWGIESDYCSRNRARRHSHRVHFNSGPSRLRRSVRSIAMLRLMSSEFSHGGNAAANSAISTLENHRARTHQWRNLLFQLSRGVLCDERETALFEIQYFLASTLEAFGDFSRQETLAELVARLKSPTLMLNVDDSQAQFFATAFTKLVNQESLLDVLSLLISGLSRLWEMDRNTFEFEKDTSLCWIYVGLLRIHLIAPGSPLDPGQKPTEKVLQLERYLQQVRSNLATIRLESGVSTGDFSPDSPDALFLLNEVEVAEQKKARQNKKRVERAAGAPPFVDLFQEARNFVKSFSAPEDVRSLAESILSVRSSPQVVDDVRSRELHWQITAGSFCDRLSSHFAPYEDVTVPFVNAVRNVQRGLRQLAEVCFIESSDSERKHVLQLMDDLLAFPLGNMFDDLASRALDLLSRLNNVPALLTPLSQTQVRVGLLMRSLCLLDIQKRLRSGRQDSTAFFTCKTIFRDIVDLWMDGSGDTLGYQNDEEVEEDLYRDQFPDHRAEFAEIIKKYDVSEVPAVAKPHQNNVCDEVPGLSFSEEHVSVLCELHRDLFSGREHVTDSCRVRAFRLSYVTAVLLGDTSEWIPRDPLCSEPMGGHVMALALRASWRTHCSKETPDSLDFHNDSNPAEILKAALPIRRLISRTSQLLTAFPGNSLLIAVGQVAEHVTKLNLSTVSVGKVMAGLELVLKKAQEWEQHASERVKFGGPLQEVSEVVASWRKLELKSWCSLLDVREKSYVLKARNHWKRLYIMLNENDPKVQSLSSTCKPLLTDSGCARCPSWVWKGCSSRKMLCLPDNSQDLINDTRLVELSQVLDGFLLTSVVGEFNERLNLIRDFSHQLFMECSHAGALNLERLQISRLLRSLWSYYVQFVAYVLEKKAQLRYPIEKRLKEEVKLAKWDEQTYYSLAESSEKNHRKLMKLLREYDEVLEIGVGTLLEKHCCFGVRQTSDSVDTNSQPLTSMPPNGIIFPSYHLCDASSTPVVESIETENEKHVWTVPDKIDVDKGSYVYRMSSFYKRMVSILQARERESWANQCAEMTGEMCGAIFERINFLRSDKATRPMKKRALVDFFRTLKKHGYMTTKWSVPKQIGEMVHLLQLPGLSEEGSLISTTEWKQLEKAERYFQRNLMEAHRLRAEISNFGSSHMSQREMHLMLGFGDHGLLMLCQQRCTLVHALLTGGDLLDTLQSFDNLGGSLPLGQRSLRRLVETFEKDFSSAVENLRQLILLLQTIRPMIHGGDESSSVQDTLTILESCLSELQLSPIPSKPSHVVTWGSLRDIAEARHLLENVKQKLKGCEGKSVHLGCLPKDIFEVCTEELARASLSAASCEEQTTFTAQQRDHADMSDFVEAASTAVKRVLLSVQEFKKTDRDERQRNDTPSTFENKPVELDGAGIWKFHSRASQELSCISLESLNGAVHHVLESLSHLHSSDALPKDTLRCCVGISSDLSFLALEFMHSIRVRISEYVHLFQNTAKLHYVMLRVFRVLVASGFCDDSVSDAAADGEDGDVSGMDFHDNQEGTGMGDGQGGKDVSDQLESEEQLLGLKGDDDDKVEDANSQQKQLNDEEAEQGMEMEGDFDGEMFDLPEDEKADDQDEENGEEELDREMGDGGDPNEEIVDEKMWNDSDNEDEIQAGEEKFERDSGVKGGEVEDELRTKENGEENLNDDSSTKESKGGDTAQNKDEEEENETEKEGEINEDVDEKYEGKSPGVDVMDQNPVGVDVMEEEEAMELGDDLQLDGESCDENDESADRRAVDEETQSLGGDIEGMDEEKEELGTVCSNDGSDAHSNEEEAIDTLMAGDGKDENERDDSEVNEAEEPKCISSSIQTEGQHEAHGVHASDGVDKVLDPGLEEENFDEKTDGKGMDVDSGDSGEAPRNQQESGSGHGDSGHGENDTSMDVQGAKRQPEMSLNAPNPFRDPGDATRFWHKKLNMIEDTKEDAELQESGDVEQDDRQDSTGEYEFSGEQQSSTTQVLGGADEDQAATLEHDEDHNDTSEMDPEVQNLKNSSDNAKKEPSTKNTNKQSGTNRSKDMAQNSSNEYDEIDHKDLVEDADDNRSSSTDHEGESECSSPSGNRAVSDLAQLRVRENSNSIGNEHLGDLVEEERVVGGSQVEAADDRKRWSEIQSEIQSLSRRLCEKLRLVMEPLVATKLRGDYRTGKRINMKRVIGYIASGYRKDKIWLRRTKPAKRNYRVMLAVDDSESMKKSGAGEMALKAMATLALGMSQLEVGELGVASFGEDMRFLHPFSQPFTSGSGARLVRNFQFDQKRTRTALCLESALSVLESSVGDAFTQLVFIISDGRIERDSRAVLRRLVREMTEKSILLVMIIVEGENGIKGKHQERIVNMKEVTFENGKPKVKRFIDDYPFPYYMVLEDMASLPEVLGDALKQWFEMLSQLNSQAT